MAYEVKTKKTTVSVSSFLAGVEDPAKRKDCQVVRKLMKEATGDSGSMWGTSIVGFGKLHYQGKSSSGEWFPVGFSPRKQNLTLYLWGGFDSNHDLLATLGPNKTGKGCLYIKRLDDIDLKVLKQLINRSVAESKKQK